MPPKSARPATTGYERLAQADRFSDDSDDDNINDGGGGGGGAGGRPRYASIVPGPTHQAPRPVSGMAASLPNSTAVLSGRRLSGNPQRRGRSNSGVDLKAINARLERWADEIAAKFKRAGGGRRRPGYDDDDEEQLEIHYSVFQAPEGVRPVTAESLTLPLDPATETYSTANVISREQFEAIVDSVRDAIHAGVHPRMISQGSSGSYFARNLDGKVVGVFKPKDEEPYAAGNPKWNKWIHRNLFPCFFGRACLIPNLSYVSEAAAYVLDAQLHTHMVPYTDVVYLSSKSFHYPFWDRYSHSRNGKPLPAKPGSFQVFLKGFKDANVFLREHPWPDQYLSGFRRSGRSRHRRRRWADSCRPTSKHGSQNGHHHRQSNGNSNGSGSGSGSGSGNSSEGGAARSDGEYEDYDDDESDDEEEEHLVPTPEHFVWTEKLKIAFREELEKLVILDYIMRNTDRGLDNWMVRVDWSTQGVSIASEPMHLNLREPNEGGSGSGSGSGSGGGSDQAPRPVDLSKRGATAKTAAYPSYHANKPMNPQHPNDDDDDNDAPQPSITVGAIDNSLSWPWKHPDAWRSFPFGWLFLPVDLIGRPFSQRTRDHFLPLLTSTAWWSQTQLALRRIFQMDPDFKERMFARQMAVMKGQAWNVVETLKTADHGPLELTRRAKVCVWDDLVEVPIAVPMRATSAEMRRRAESELAKAMDEEMDIGVTTTTTTTTTTAASAASAAEHEVDLLGLNGSPQSKATHHRLPNPGRFELTKDVLAEEPSSTTSTSALAHPDLFDDGTQTPASPPPSINNSNLTTQKHKSISFQEGGSSSSASKKALNVYAPPRQQQQQSSSSSSNAAHERRYSFTTAASRRNSNSIAQQLYGDHIGTATAAPGPTQGTSTDDAYAYLYDEAIEGDLGYAAAEGMENNRRRVIVERLEPVKSKNPVFTWC